MTSSHAKRIPDTRPERAQHIRVYGVPVLCHSDGCENDAAAIFRIITEDDVESLVLCAACWRTWREAYRQAEWDTEVAVRFAGPDNSDDEEGCAS